MSSLLESMCRGMLGLVAGVVVVAGAMLTACAPGAETIDVAAIYTVSAVDHPWVSRVHKALKAAQERGDITYVFSENVSPTDYERVLREYADAGKQLIVGEAFGAERVARQVTADYPKTAFLMAPGFGRSGGNFAVYDNWIHEPSYLTGMVAGSLTKSNLIGLVGGNPIPQVNRLMHAFMDGAREVNPEAEFLVNFVGSWENESPKVKEATFAMIDAGADILYAERFAVSAAARERGVKTIGKVIDTQADYPGVVIASALWHMEPTINRAIEAVRNGSFEAADYGQYSYLGYGGGSLAPMDPKLVPQKVIDLVMARRQQILHGTFRVNINDSEPRSTR